MADSGEYVWIKMKRRLGSDAKVAEEACEHIAALEGALESIRNEKHYQGCDDLPKFDVAPGGHECSCPQKWARAALAKLKDL